MKTHSIWEARVGEFRANAAQIALRPKKVCAWKYPGCIEVIEEGDPGALISRGLCESCSVEFMKREKIASSLSREAQ